MKVNERVERACRALLEDVERLGPLSRGHVVEVASRRDLSAEETALLLELLLSAEALEGSTHLVAELSPVASEAPHVLPGAPNADEASEIKIRHEMPGKISKHPIMRAHQEVELGRRIQMGLKAKEAVQRGEDSVELRALAKDGDVARQMMIVNNCRLVYDVAKRFISQSGDLDLDDLVQEGMRGLNRAAEKYDPSLGYKFSTYATWWIRQSISRAIADTGTTVRLPVHVWEQWRQIVRYRRDFETRNGRLPSLVEVSEALGKDPGTVKAITDFASPLVHLDAVVAEDPDGVTLGSLLLHQLGPSVEHEVLDAVVLRAIETRVEEIAANYDRRFMRILEGRAGLHGHEQMTLEQLGAEFKITRERVRQLEKRVLRILREDPILTTLVRDYLEDCHGAA
ncbi:sigma-70 family RNA polymerase sigma factor [Nonomuraea jabiensis]|uniref:sigma-70 family RNA polymerase sigma factor n=1 Tax=Nonomuraea jabiensis TaxID=882448 RepID=UPI003D718FCC